MEQAIGQGGEKSGDYWVAPIIQGAISSAATRADAWDIIQAAPAGMRERLISHARTVWALRSRQKKAR